MAFGAYPCRHPRSWRTRLKRGGGQITLYDRRCCQPCHARSTLRVASGVSRNSISRRPKAQCTGPQRSTHEELAPPRSRARARLIYVDLALNLVNTSLRQSTKINRPHSVLYSTSATSILSILPFKRPHVEGFDFVHL